jgi:hypothetical protein
MNWRQVYFPKSKRSRNNKEIKQVTNGACYYIQHHVIQSNIKYKIRMIKTDITRYRGAWIDLSKYLNIVGPKVLIKIIMDYLLIEDISVTLIIKPFISQTEICIIDIIHNKICYAFGYNRTNNMIVDSTTYNNLCQYDSLRQLFNSINKSHFTTEQMNTVYNIVIILYEYIKQIRYWK